MVKKEKIPKHRKFTKLEVTRYHIIKFMQWASKKIKKTDIVLDAGAGPQPFRKYFEHAKYVATDFEQQFDENTKAIQDFICSLEDIPKKNNTYNAIICTEVLEHIEHPPKAINELYRILKPGGKLFLTTPQASGVHHEPYNFFHCTKYGLESMFKEAGFKIHFIKPMGGIFKVIGKRFRTFPYYILRQYKGFKKYLLAPFYVVLKPFCEIIIPWLLWYIDGLDKKQNYTVGYSCYCTKPKKKISAN